MTVNKMSTYLETMQAVPVPELDIQQ